MFFRKLQDSCRIYTVTRPIVPAALLCAAGTTAGLFLPLSSLQTVLTVFVCSVLLLAAALFLFRRHPFARYIAIVVFITVASVFHAQRADLPYDRAGERLCYAADNGTRCVVTGEVVAVRAPSKASRGELKYRFSLRNCAVKGEADDEFLPLWGALPVIWYGKPPEKAAITPERGMGIETCVKIWRRRSATPTSTNAEDYYAIGRERSTGILPAGGGENTLLEKWRRNSADRVAFGLDDYPEEKSLLHAMMFGYRSGIPRETNSLFRKAGTIHIFAISGLHVLLIARILMVVLAYAGVPATTMVFPLTPLIAFYIFATGGQPSALRAGLMCFLFCAAPLFDRKPDALNAVSLAGLVILAFDPLQIREIGFIMSFVMVLGLIIAGGKIHSLITRICRCRRQAEYLDLKEYAFSAETAAFVRPWYECCFFNLQKFLYICETKILKYVSAAVTAALISLPLTSYFYGYFTTYSFIANVVVVPMAFVTLCAASIGLLLSCCYPILSLPCNIAAAICAGTMKQISQWCVTIPGSGIGIELSLRGVVLWYIVLVLVIRKIKE